MGFNWLIVTSFLQLHDILDADEHYVATSYKIIETFVGALFYCGGGSSVLYSSVLYSCFPYSFGWEVLVVLLKPGGSDGASWGLWEFPPRVLVESVRWAWLQRGLLWLPAALSRQVRACAAGFCWGATRGGLMADGGCRHRTVPRQMSIAGIRAHEERELFTVCCERCGLALILCNFCWNLWVLKSVNRVSMWLLHGRKLIATSGTDERTRRGCSSVHEQAVACSWVNSHILRSLNRSSEVTTPGHMALHRGISCPASCCTQFHFPCFCVSCSFKPFRVVSLSSCFHIVAKLETITNPVSPFCLLKKGEI